MPYYFSGSSIKFKGHTGWKIDDLNPIWVKLLGRSQLSNPSDLPCFFLDSLSRVRVIHGALYLEEVCLDGTYLSNRPVNLFLKAVTASAPSHPIQHPTAGMGTHMIPVGCVMVGCCQINYIITNIGRRNSIPILNQHPLFWNILIWTEFICFINLFCILKIKVALISCSWSKMPSKA